MEDILAERDACGVGFIASLKGERTHKTVADALRACGCMEHRGACSADDDSGDGAGVMTQIPWKLLNKWAAENGKPELAENATGVGMVFLPKTHVEESRAMAEERLAAEGFQVLGWREVPVDESIVGPYALATIPRIEQVFVAKDGLAGADLERELFVARKAMEAAAAASDDADVKENFYVCNISCRTIVYKGMLRSAVLGEFFLDLKDEDYESSFSIYHRRFSTNTRTAWDKVQPFRLIAHNGEINTIAANHSCAYSREQALGLPPDELLTHEGVSDSGALNGMVEAVEKIWLDGELVPWGQAQVHVLTHTLHYGLGAFEGIRCYETEDGRSAIFRLRAALLTDAARSFDPPTLTYPYRFDEWSDISAAEDRLFAMLAPAFSTTASP